MELAHPTFISMPAIAVLALGLVFLIQQRHFVLGVEEQQRLNQAALDEAIMLMNF